MNDFVHVPENYKAPEKHVVLQGSFQLFVTVFLLVQGWLLYSSPHQFQRNLMQKRSSLMRKIKGKSEPDGNTSLLLGA